MPPDTLDAVVKARRLPVGTQAEAAGRLPNPFKAGNY